MFALDRVQLYWKGGAEELRFTLQCDGLILRGRQQVNDCIERG